MLASYGRAFTNRSAKKNYRSLQTAFLRFAASNEAARFTYTLTNLSIQGDSAFAEIHARVNARTKPTAGSEKGRRTVEIDMSGVYTFRREIHVIALPDETFAALRVWKIVAVD